MLIKSIEYKNFRQFINEKIEFSTDRKKNTTVILAGNTSGKSTIVESFRWCFYGEVKLPKPKEICNRMVFNKLQNQEKTTISVKVELKHQNIDYIVERTQIVKKVNSNNKYSPSDISIKKKNINGVYETVNSEMNISEIVPEELMSYFFFTGERFDVLVDNKADGKKDISNAVKSILGLQPIELAIKDLDHVYNSFKYSLIDNLGAEAEGYKRQLNELNKKISTANESIQRKKIEKDSVVKMKDDLYTRLQNNPNEEKEKKIKEIKQGIKKSEEIIKDNIRSLKTSFKSLMPRALYTRIHVCNKELFDDLKPNESNFTGINLATLERVLSTKTCICGRRLEEGSKEFDAIKDLIDDINKSEQNINEDNAVSRLNSYISEGQRGEEFFFADVNKKMHDLTSSMEQLDSFELQLNDAYLYDENEESFEENKRLYEKYHTREVNLDNEIRMLEDEIKKCSLEKEKVDANIENISKKEKKNSEIHLKMKCCSKIKDELNLYYKHREEMILTELNKKVSDLFGKLIRTRHTIEIDNKYRFNVKDVDGVEATSDGADVLTAMAFIGGLISLAKENSESLNSYEPYPLVLDSPFGKLEIVHQKNVAVNLPKIPEQFILLVSDSQFTDVVSENLESSVGKMWTINVEYGPENDKIVHIRPQHFGEV